MNLLSSARTRHPDPGGPVEWNYVNALQKPAQYMLDEVSRRSTGASLQRSQVGRVPQRRPGPRLVGGRATALTPYYVDVAGSVIQTWHPAGLGEQRYTAADATSSWPATARRKAAAVSDHRWARQNLCVASGYGQQPAALRGGELFIQEP